MQQTLRTLTGKNSVEKFATWQNKFFEKKNSVEKFATWQNKFCEKKKLAKQILREKKLAKQILREKNIPAHSLIPVHRQYTVPVQLMAK